MKQNILLLHGALGTKQQFQDLKQKLATKFNVHDLDFEGHGTNSSTKEFSMELFANNVIAYLSAHKIDQTNIFGYSMGGYVGLTLASKKPELVRKIVTLGTKFAWTKDIAEQEIKMLNPDKIAAKVPKFAAKLTSIHGTHNWKNVVSKTARMMHGLGNGKKLTTKELAQIEHKVLIGIGSLDKMVTVEESSESSTILPNGQLQIIEGFRHPIERIDTAKLAKIIIDFIMNNASSSL